MNFEGVPEKTGGTRWLAGACGRGRTGVRRAGECVDELRGRHGLVEARIEKCTADQEAEQQGRPYETKCL